ncbi:hypothetical protein C8Q80DRAFT_1307690 [Daedaleopsis nitida]|nr:hypothetical protein C8Q80DRAFT_1307690 [Daedaleopsis nitida]
MQGAGGFRIGQRSIPTRRTPPQYRHGMTPEEMTRYIKEYKEWFEEDRRIPPEPALLLDRASLISEQVYRRADLEAASHAEKSSGVQFYLTMVGFAKHSSFTPLADLSPIRFGEMLVRRAHVGRYLMCRIVAPCTRLVAIQTIVEDVDGVAHDLSIYNFPSTFECTLEHVDAIFHVGTILAIREPTFKTPMQGDRPLVRIDSPTDIVFIVPNSPWLQGVNWKTGPSVPRSPVLPTTVETWQKRGNDHFKLSQWFLAAFAYSQGLALMPDAAVLLLNRAESFLRLGFYSGALCDAQRVLSTDGAPDAQVGKAIFRLAKAQYGRGEYVAAEQNFLRWKKDHTEDTMVNSWIERCRSRNRERETGEYDWVSLFRIARQKIRLDVADYAGPIEVGQMAHRGGGRGVVATKSIRTGDLLMVAKPFVSAYASDLPKNKMIMTLDLISNASKERTDAVLLSRIIERLYGNPDLHDEPVAVNPLEPQVEIDIAQLEAICTYNNFCPFRIENHAADSETRPTGLYPLASLFNHSCAPNAIWYCVGDAIVIRAAEPIATGTEITIPYSVEESYQDRQSALQKHMLEHCTCWLCEADRGDGEARLRRRHELKSRLVSRELFAASLAEVRALEKDVRETFAPSRGPVRPLSALALHVLAEKLRASRNPRSLKEALQVDMDALRCFGFEVVDLENARGAPGSRGLPIGTDRFPSLTTFIEPVAMMLRIACTYLNLHDEANAVQWMKAALWLTNISVGGGKAMFLLVHEELLDQMNIRDLAAQVL